MPASRLADIRAIADDICQRQGGNKDLLRVLQLTFDKERLRKAFPRRILELEPSEDSGQECFKFNPDYLEHLVSLMRLTSDSLNKFLQAAGSERSFSYGSSKYYNRASFEEVLYCEWPAQTIPLNLEKRLLDRIAAAH